MDPYHLAMGMNRCPACGQGALFKGWLTLHDTCEACGARYFRDPGNWTAPTAFGYGIGAATAVAMMVILWFVNGLAAGSEWVIIGVSVGVTLLSFRFVKAWWVALIYQFGYVYADTDVARAEDAEPGAAAGPTPVSRAG
jgi:uncharacterized protein (DUF983 family)